MFNFGIDGYEARWLHRWPEVVAEHGGRLRGLVGRVFTRSWLAWDLGEDIWFADCPVLLDFQGEQVEINHQKFDDLSITWNTADPARPLAWSTTDGFRLSWRDDTPPELAALHGQTVRSVDLLEWFPLDAKDFVDGALAVSFTFDAAEFVVYNALDENGLLLGPPADPYRRHRVG